MDFIDEAKIYIRAGHGGKGCMSLRREKYVPMGGPDGGNGGKGGDVIVRANPQLNTLLDFKYQQHYFAENGRPGGGKQMTGRSGDDLLIEVPMGTLLIHDETKEEIADLNQPGKEICIAKGGLGGRGNHSFKSSVNQAPRKADDGELGEEFTLRLNLKVLADVAIVGFPNAGKSTLLKAHSAAKPKVADYPFTTLTPQLGVVNALGKSFVLADIPGLISGAHQGKGLGIRFLKHLERTRLYWFLLDPLDGDTFLEPDELIEQYHSLCNEMKFFNESLLSKPHFFVLNKKDLNLPETTLNALKNYCKKEGIPFFHISGIIKVKCPPLLRETLIHLDTLNKQCA